jgi:hypothetical protein
MPRPGATIASATLFNSVRSMVSSYMIRIVLNIIARHCEGRSDGAIQRFAASCWIASLRCQ